MAKISQYQRNLAQFAGEIEGGLSNLQRSEYCVLQNHVMILRTVVSLIQFKLSQASESQGVNPKALFVLDTELHNVRSIVMQLSIKDDNFTLRSQIPQDVLVYSLKMLKSLVSLAKFKSLVKNSTALLVDILNKMGAISPALKTPATGSFTDANGTIADETAEQMIKGFMNFCLNLTQFSGLTDDLGLNLNIDYKTAASQDVARVAGICFRASEGLNQGESRMQNAESIRKTMKKFKALCKKNMEIRLLTAGGLTNEVDLLKEIDSEIINALYANSKMEVQVQHTNPSPGDILGSGIFGTVIRGKINRTEAAFKYLDFDPTVFVTLSSASRTELTGEFRNSILQLDHPNIAKVFSLMAFDSKLFFPVERLHVSLDKFLHKNTSPEMEMSADMGLSILLGILRGLKYLHSNSIVHGTLHPGNILLSISKSSTGIDLAELKLVDYGLHSTKKDLSLAAMMATTPGNPKIGRKFLAPEMLSDAKLTFSCDIYAVALIFWELCQGNMEGGKRVFDSLSGDNLAKDIVENKTRPELEGKHMQPWMKQTIYQCWAHEPWLRPTAVEVLRLGQKGVASQLNVPRPKSTPNEASAMPSRITARADARASARRVVKQLALSPANISGHLGDNTNAPDLEGSRLSRNRTSLVHRNSRSTSTSRNSVVLQTQKFTFLDEVTADSKLESGIKVVKAMRFYTGDAELQLKAISGLRQLLLSPQQEVELMRMGVGNAVLAAIKNHVAEAPIVEVGLGAVSSLSVDPYVAEALMKLGALTIVMDSMKKHLKDEHVQVEGLMAITNLAKASSLIQELFLEQGLMDHVLEVFTLHGKKVSVVTEACALLSQIQTHFTQTQKVTPELIKQKLKRFKLKKSSKKPKTALEDTEDAFDMGGHHPVLKALIAFPDNPELQAYGMYALEFMVKGFDYRKKVLLKSGLIGIIKQALVTHKTREDVEVQEAGIRLMSEIAQCKDSHSEILKSKIYEDILKALKKFDGDNDVQLQYKGVLALSHFCSHNAKAAKALLKADAHKQGYRTASRYDYIDKLVTYGELLAQLVVGKGVVKKHLLKQAEKIKAKQNAAKKKKKKR